MASIGNNQLKTNRITIKEKTISNARFNARFKMFSKGSALTERIGTLPKFCRYEVFLKYSWYSGTILKRIRFYKPENL